MVNILPRNPQFLKIHDKEAHQGSDSVFHSLTWALHQYSQVTEWVTVPARWLVQEIAQFHCVWVPISYQISSDLIGNLSAGHTPQHSRIRKVGEIWAGLYQLGLGNEPAQMGKIEDLIILTKDYTLKSHTIFSIFFLCRELSHTFNSSTCSSHRQVSSALLLSHSPLFSIYYCG